MKGTKTIREKIWIGFLAIFAAVGMTCTTSVEPYYTTAQGLEGLRLSIVLLQRCIRSMSSDIFMLSLIALFAGWLIISVRKKAFGLRDRVIAGVFSIFFSGMQLLCHSYSEHDSWIEIFGSGFVFCRAVVIITGTAIFVYQLTLLAMHLLDRISQNEVRKGGVFNKKSYIIASLLVLLCWIPYFIYFFPGTSGNDTATQIAQFFGQSTWTRKMSPVRGEDIYFSNHFPYLTTLLMGGAVKLGILFGDSAIGVAIYSAIQMIIMAFTLTGVWFYLHWAGLSFRCLKAGLLFTAFVPMYPMYAICMMKDPMFAVFCLVLAVLLFEIVRSKGISLQNRKFCAVLFADCLLMMLFRSQGVYILGVIVVATLAVYRRYWLRVVVSMLVPVLLFQMVWIRVLLPAWNVAPGGKQEMLGIFFQQTARYVSLYPDHVTKKEKKAIKKVLAYNHLAENYTPELADGVKFTFKQDSSSEDLAGYFKAWFSMFRKHPGVYVEAVINNCSDYFYLPYTSNLYCVSFTNKSQWEEDGDIYVHAAFLTYSMSRLALTMTQFAQKIPLLNLLFSIGAYSWVVIWFFFFTIRKKNYSWLIPGAVAILSVGILLIGPANGRFRYTIPIFYQMPFLIGLCILQGQRRINSEQETGNTL